MLLGDNDKGFENASSILNRKFKLAVPPFFHALIRLEFILNTDLGWNFLQTQL